MGPEFWTSFMLVETSLGGKELDLWMENSWWLLLLLLLLWLL